MDEFIKVLEEFSNSSMKLSNVWNQLDEHDFNKISQHYPFNHNFEEIVQQILHWKSSLIHNDIQK
jgi:hypothetical protein